ncbi:unnamed protein product [Clonostachys rhizophaga]|uniref:Isotrichodermin C-15 hydroxylase n=1 Tax=Clonostachys rhizophaga TaxID=160324 RepID=A0A9N9VLI4_9HYPO|nr:unnamed protein product [Clonostachys rhizophaga]
MGNLSALSQLSWWSWLTLSAATAVLLLICKAIFNVFFHPLRSYPGPWYRAASRLPYSISIFRGSVTHRVQKLHEKYGQVVRIAPDSLSYTSSQAWPDVYGLKQSQRRGNLPKDPKFYVKPPGSIDTISTANDADHRRLRRLQAHAFSEKALALQESYLQRYTGKFITCLEKEASQSGGVVDIVKWVNFLTTDLIGDLSFGESFGGLDTGKVHPWLESLFNTLRTFTLMREIFRLPPFLVAAAMAFIPEKMKKHEQESQSFGAAVAKRRLERGSDRPDFMSYILKHQEEQEKRMSQAEVEMASITFIVAGSETTATMISGTIYLLLCNPSVLSRLTTVIRADFPKESDLTNINLQQHEYLNAVLKEGLRLYPPAPDTLFRTTEKESVIVAGRVVPPHTKLTMNLWAAHRDPTNFRKPLEFIPERWVKDAPLEFSNDDRAVFKPFSVGPRDCLGKNLAWAEMRLILAKLLWSFDLLSLQKDSEQWIERQKIFTLWEKLPLNVKVTYIR